MKLEDYQTIIEKTAVYPKEVGIGYTVLGLIGESLEFRNAVGEVWVDLPEFKPTELQLTNIKKEAGDVCWYITATCNELSIPLSKVMSGDHPLAPFEYEVIHDYADFPFYFAGKIAERAKKWLRDGTMNEDIKVEITKNLSTIYHSLKGLCEYFDIEMEDVLETNYKKLIKRRETGTLHGSGDNREENI